jgi:acyl-CoA thioesterase
MSLAEKVLKKMTDEDAFSRWMGLVVDGIGAGTCHLHYTILPEMLNGFGMVHGGIVFSAADSAFAFACNSHGRLAVALDVAITFTKSAKIGEILRVEAKEVHLGNKISLYDITTRNEKDEIVAVFKGTAYRTSKEIIEMGE